MIPQNYKTAGLSLLFSVLLSGCLTTAPAVFSDRPVINVRDDKNNGPLPKKNDYDFVEDTVHSAVRLPVNEYLDFRRTPRSQDVNAYDEVPQSTWFTPRLGYQNLSADQILKGPSQAGPPQRPITVVKAKNKGNSPGFVIKDARSLNYLIKFDADEFPGAQTAVNLISNRLFWAFGYNVPEDYLFEFKAEDLNYGLTDEKGLSDIQFIMMTQTPSASGYYRTTASLFVPGEILGPTFQTGTRKGDINDTIAHENLRTLRALKVFGALLDHTGMRSDNSLDTFITENGKSYTKHYLLDFGETLGVHGLEKHRNWDSYEHFFSFKDSALKYISLGIPVQPWEHLENSPEKYEDAFRSDTFKASAWKETWQFQPIRQSQPDDDYWAAKILQVLTPAHIEPLFKSAGNETNADYLSSLKSTLLKRRNQILEEVYASVSPLELQETGAGFLVFSDISGEISPSHKQRQYEVRFFDKKGKKAAPSVIKESSDGKLTVNLPAATDKYLNVTIAPLYKNKPHSRPAEFHFKIQNPDQPELLGVLH